MSPRIAGRPLSDEAQGDLGPATLIHELKQPLFAIKGLAQLARAEGRALEASDIDRLLGFIDHLESLLEEHETEASAELASPLDLNAIVRSALALLEFRRQAVGARVELRLWPEPLVVRARPVALRRVVLNLLHNALDAVESQRSGRVLIRSERVEDGVRLMVQDTGAGIPHAMRSRVFEPFVTTKSPGRGTGLGLYVARHLVEEVSGRLELDCPEGGGTLACVHLPAPGETQVSSPSSPSSPSSMSSNTSSSSEVA